jgi:hypothetical protein
MDSRGTQAGKEVINHSKSNAALSIFYTVFGFRFSVKKTRIISKLKLKLVALGTVAHGPIGPPVKHEKWQILMVRGTHPTLAGTEARPTNLKLET